MTESQILQQLLEARTLLDATLVQSIGLTFALIVATYYFLHQAGWFMKVSALVLYIIGWLTFMLSGIMTSRHLEGLLRALSELARTASVSPAATEVLASFNSPVSKAFIVMANTVNFVLLFGSISLLLFWKRKAP